MKNLRSAAVAAALLSLGTVFYAPNAIAGTGKSQMRNCVIEADVVSVNGAPVQGPKVVNEPVCFDSIGAGLTYATGGVISAESSAGTDTPAEAAALVKSAEGKSDVGLQSVIIGLFYDSTNYGGGTIYTVTAASSGCSMTLGFGISYVGSAANDDIASGASYSRCFHKVYEDANYGGAAAGYYDYDNSYGVLNEEISSIYFSFYTS